MIKVCLVCGKPFEACNNSNIICSPECRKIRKESLRTNELKFDTTIINLKLYEILEIMKRENITISEYLDNRDYYIMRYITNRGFN